MVMADLSEVPFYNADKASDKPKALLDVFHKLQKADALVLACAEYNYSMAPALKNLLDWASREPDNALLAGKPVAIMGAGGGMGTSRAQHHLRQVCVYLDLHPLNKPEIFSNAFSSSFNGEGDLVDEKIQSLVAEQMAQLAAWTRKLNR
jgi:chromate reductase